MHEIIALYFYLQLDLIMSFLQAFCKEKYLLSPSLSLNIFAVFKPLTLFPYSLNGGDTMPIPITPGITIKIVPLTPLFIGIPTSLNHFSLLSYKIKLF